ncbi:MAG: hypothetical protein LBI98_03340 [Endomicrobium sp.]|jgi:putative FmdB family regulatory protein|nr:hypothetical protein [Endomicrobium sp.]
MPLFEFICKKCCEKFEALVFSKEKVECPKCKSNKITKQFSSFSSSLPSNCASAGLCPSVVGNKHKCPDECCHR